MGPTKRAAIEGLTDAQVLSWLLEDPRRLRRPIIDTGDSLYLGFGRAVRQALSP